MYDSTTKSPQDPAFRALSRTLIHSLFFPKLLCLARNLARNVLNYGANFWKMDESSFVQGPAVFSPAI